jgi:uncharacterized membrane protein YhaH (DUF805 family)
MKAEHFRILWKGQISGPFSREQVEKMLSKNEIGVWAEISVDNSSWKPISEWRIRKPVFKPSPKLDKPESQPAVPSAIGVEPVSSRMEDDPDLPPLPDEGFYKGSGEAKVTDFADNEDNNVPNGFFFWAFMPFRKYGIFSGRARRKEYWLFYFFNFIVGFFIGLMDALKIFNTTEGSLLIGCYTLLLIIPSWAVTIRRLHDTNRSGWWTLLLFTGIGSLVLLLFTVQEGTEGENDFGADPKEPYIS